MHESNQIKSNFLKVKKESFPVLRSCKVTSLDEYETDLAFAFPVIIEHDNMGT